MDMFVKLRRKVKVRIILTDFWTDLTNYPGKQCGGFGFRIRKNAAPWTLRIRIQMSKNVSKYFFTCPENTFIKYCLLRYWLNPTGNFCVEYSLDLDIHDMGRITRDIGYRLY